MIIILWIGLCFLVAFAGKDKKITYWGTFFVSLLLSPLIGLIFALITSPVQATTVSVSTTTYTCKHCKLSTSVNSHFCPGCDRDDHGKTKLDYSINN